MNNYPLVTRSILGREIGMLKMIKLKLIKLLALGVCLAAEVPVSATNNPLGNNYRKIMRELGTQRSDLTLLASHRGVHALYPLEDQDEPEALVAFNKRVAGTGGLFPSSVSR
jgi:hypothetical protein